MCTATRVRCGLSIGVTKMPFATAFTRRERSPHGREIADGLDGVAASVRIDRVRPRKSVV